MPAETSSEPPHMPIVAPREGHRWTRGRVARWIGAAIGLVIVLAAIDVVVRYIPAFVAIQHGRDAVAQAETDIRQAISSGDDASFQAAATQLTTIRTDFTSSSSVIDDGWLAGIADHLPFLSDQVEAARDMRHAGAAGAQLGLDLLPMLQQVTAHDSGTGTTGVLGRLYAAASQPAVVATAEGDLNDLDNAIAAIPTGTLIGPLDHTRTTLQTQGRSLSSDAHIALNLIGVAPNLFSGTKRYLVLIENPGEERPGGGFIGAVGELDISNGRLTREAFQDSGFANGRVPPEPAPRPLDDYLFHGVPMEMSDANWSADFPSAAANVARFYTEATGVHVDGEISVDPVALSYILDVIGPVKVPPYPQVITASNTLKEISYITNKARPGDPGKVFLPPFAQVLFDRLLKPSGSQLGGVVSALGRGIREKHIVFSFTDSAAENLVSSANAGGQVLTPPVDSLLVTDANLSGGKEDLYVTRHFTLNATVGSDGSVHDKLVLTYTNPVLTNPADLWLDRSSGGAYRDYIQVFVPSGASLDGMSLTAGGSTQPVSAEDIATSGDKTVISYFLVVSMGQTASLEIDESGPYGVGGAGYDLGWEKQVNALPWPITVTVTTPGHAARTWSTDLSVDRDFATP